MPGLALSHERIPPSRPHFSHLPSGCPSVIEEVHGHAEFAFLNKTPNSGERGRVAVSHRLSHHASPPPHSNFKIVWQLFRWPICWQLFKPNTVVSIRRCVVLYSLAIRHRRHNTIVPSGSCMRSSAQPGVPHENPRNLGGEAT